MARTADHDARRRQVTAAVRALIPEVGFDEVTISRVAARAGVSVGLVQYYFASKDELLRHTYQEVVGTVRGRVEECIAEGDRAQQPIREVLLAAFAQLLPLDAERRAEYRICQTFLGRAVDNPALAAVATATAADIRAGVTRAVENGKVCGEVAAEVDAATAALGMVALVDGLAARIYQESDATVGAARMPAAALAVLRDRIGEVFVGECRHYRR